MSDIDAKPSSGVPSNKGSASTERSVFRQMYRITADREVTFEEKTRRLIDLGRQYLDLPYGFLTRIEGDGLSETTGGYSNAGIQEGVQRVLYASGDHPLLQSGKTCPLSEAYCRKTIQQEELLSVQHAPSSGWEQDPAYERFELGSYIGARIIVEGGLYGTFCFASHEVRDQSFDQDEEAFVELLTRWAGYELERQRSRERIEQFAELVTHDLRNPLNAAQMNLVLIDRLLDRDRTAGGGAPDTPVGEADHQHDKLSQFLDSTERALARMEDIITDTLALAHGEQRLGPDDVAPIQLRTIVEASWEQAGSADATLQIEHTPAASVGRPGEASDDAAPPGTFLAHEGRLRQLLENLIRNAVDHAGPDVTVTIGRTEDGFYVADDGPGIPPDEREQVFETSYSTREGGTGLGLAIARAVANAHGWSLSVSESAAGGARFDIAGVQDSRS